MIDKFAPFASLDLGTVKPTSIPTRKIEVDLSSGELVENYGKAFVSEAIRKNPLKAEQVQLSADEVVEYCKYLLAQRVKCVEMNCPDFRKMKVLYIPAYIQYCLAMVGIVNLRDRGIQLVPVCNIDTIDFATALKISEKIGSFEDDLQIVQDAMPRDINGDRDVMSTAMIAGYMRSLKAVEHVGATYAAAFMNMKLKQEAAFQALYEVQYDDIGYIISALTTQKGIY